MSEERGERLRRQAEQILNDGSFGSTPLAAGTFKEVVHELYVHQAELEIQNEELRTAQQSLEASRQEYLQLFQSLPLACFTINAAGIVCTANPAAERQFGLAQHRLRGRPLTLLVDLVDHGRLFTALHRLRESGAWVRQEYRFNGARGAIDGLTDARPLALEDGEKGDILITLTDVTERNAWVREVQSAREEADRARAAYHLILQAVADGIVGLDVDGRMTFANTAAESITGFPASALVGQPASQLFAEGGPGEGREAVRMALTDGRPRQVTGQRLRGLGREGIVAELNVTPILNYGRITGGVIAFRDVTARLAAETALRTSELRHRTLVQSLHEGLVMRSADGAVLVANRMAERLLSGPAAALLDPLAKPLAPPIEGGRAEIAAASTVGRRFIAADGSRLRGLPPAARAFAGGQPVVDRVIGITGEDGSGAIHWLRVSSHPVRDGDGRVEAVVSSVSDVTQIKAMERELNVALDAKERFIAAASHDLRQPVQALLLLAGLVLKQELPPNARRLAEQFRDTAVSLGGLLDALLDISRLEAGLVTPVIGDLELHHLMERLHREFAPMAAAKGLRLSSVPARLSMQTDGPLLERVMRNLLSNALRYTRTGRVLFGARRRGNRVRIEVWDTGIGIPENQLDRIFQDFYQVGNVARSRSEGLGMGLSIARRLAAMLGGSIDVSSNPSRGSCFRVTIPVVLPACGARPAAAARAGAPEPPADRVDAMVLLVEDDPVIRMALGLMLEDWGYRVALAGSAAEADAHIDAGVAPDIVLADYRLPEGETGLILMDRIRDRLGHDLPGILLTGDTSSDRLREASAARCALLHKPIDPDDLRGIVRSCLTE